MPSAIEISSRLKAARWLVGSSGSKPAPLSVEELVQRKPLKKNKITKNRIEEIEQAKTEARSMELEKIAEALGLPHAWFTAEDWRHLIHKEPSEQESRWRRVLGLGKPLSEEDLDDLMPEFADRLRRLQADLEAVNARLGEGANSTAPSIYETDLKVDAEPPEDVVADIEKETKQDEGRGDATGS
jgi:transcriptional regulator with XRE-family HTH domain